MCQRQLRYHLSHFGRKKALGHKDPQQPWMKVPVAQQLDSRSGNGGKTVFLQAGCCVLSELSGSWEVEDSQDWSTEIEHPGEKSCQFSGLEKWHHRVSEQLLLSAAVRIGQGCQQELRLNHFGDSTHLPKLVTVYFNQGWEIFVVLAFTAFIPCKMTKQ